MLSKKEVYQKAAQILQNRRIERETKAKENQEKAFALDKQIETYFNALKQKSAQLVRFAFSQDESQSFEALQKESTQIRETLESLLQKHHLPKDFLYPKPVCDRCLDQGFLGQERCECFQKLVAQISARDLQNASPLQLTSFLDFSLDYYEKEIDDDLGISPYHQMQRVYQFCLQYAEFFEKNARGILMIGKTGLGKTHLSLAIAQRVIEKGYIVLYDTASELTRRLSNQFFGKDKQEDLMEQICEADLLIIDDLGAEFESSFSSSAIYDILNTRVCKALPTIINTNLTAEELQERYGERVVSRLFSLLTPLSFTGKDIRVLKQKV